MEKLMIDGKMYKVGARSRCIHCNKEIVLTDFEYDVEWHEGPDHKPEGYSYLRGKWVHTRHGNFFCNDDQKTGAYPSGKKPYERRVEFDPAEPGIGPLIIRFILIGEYGASYCTFFTPFIHPEFIKENPGNAKWLWDHAWEDEKRTSGLIENVIGVHQPMPVVEGEKPTHEHCPYLDGRPCYVGNRGAKYLELAELLITKGQEAIWEILETEYEISFGELPGAHVRKVPQNNPFKDIKADDVEKGTEEFTKIKRDMSPSGE